MFYALTIKHFKILGQEYCERMISIDWGKGYALARLERNDICVTSSMLTKNAGWQNLLKLPIRCAWIGRYSFPEDLKSILKDEFIFQNWLQEQFYHLPDGTYVIWVWRDSLRWVKRGEKRYQKVRPWAGLARFEIQDGIVQFNQAFRKNAKGKLYKAWAIFADQQEAGTAMIPRPKIIKL